MIQRWLARFSTSRDGEGADCSSWRRWARGNRKVGHGAQLRAWSYAVDRRVHPRSRDGSTVVVRQCFELGISRSTAAASRSAGGCTNSPRRMPSFAGRQCRCASSYASGRRLAAGGRLRATSKVSATQRQACSRPPSDSRTSRIGSGSSVFEPDATGSRPRTVGTCGRQFLIRSFIPSG